MSDTPEYVRIAHACYSKNEWKDMEDQLALQGKKLWLYNGEIGFESDTNRYKVGKGPDVSWSEIPYYQEGLVIERGLRTAQASDEDKKITAQIRDDQSPEGKVIAFQIKQGDNGSYDAFLHDGTMLQPIATAPMVEEKIDTLSDHVEEQFSALNIQNNELVDEVKGGIQQTQDQEAGIKEGYFNFKDKNSNASSYDTDIKKWNDGEEVVPYGAQGDYAAVFGGKAAALGKRSFAEGTTTIAKGKYSHSEGNNSVALGDASHAEGAVTTTRGYASHAEGNTTISYGLHSHAEGELTKAYGQDSHAEGYKTEAGSTTNDVSASHAEGRETKAKGKNSHAEGCLTTANGQDSHAEGKETLAQSSVSHSEGYNNKVYAIYSHAEGWGNTIGTQGQNESDGSSGRASHVGGRDNVVTHDYVLAHGHGLQSTGDYQALFGRYNDPNKSGLLIVGFGEQNSGKNVFTVSDSGDIRHTGNLHTYGEITTEGKITFCYYNKQGPHKISLEKILVKLLDKNIVSLSDVEIVEET